ncbi:hypothetical protein NM208_g11911 [Fusarium decemcellulare]|uniref:Uncharacterized protein n=1 Tax=Fusarium decemcellulare TaxID=57161 RepID=A0ACC1RQP6_9HYPO|nr:hypothetical protein NM208_g11911 [Fusarium decemcellulare]
MAPPQKPAQVAFRIHFVYRVFFLVLEPISALVGAFFSHFRQETYLNLLNAESAPSSALVLRSTADLRVWRTVLFVLLLADVGHLYSMSELGARIYWDVAGWNVSDLGNVPWVYVGMTMRICFLAGIGLGESRALKKKDWKKQ